MPRVAHLLPALALGALALAGPAAASHGGKHVSGTIAASTTWTTADSPYVLDGSVTVAAGATLTIEPGVVVKLNGTTRMLTVNGRLIAEGTEEAPILITSAQDDSFEAGGDTNRDGNATAPAPGQWMQIWIRADGSSFRHAEIRYGGYGSGGYYAYGAVNVTAGAATFERVSIHDNSYSGIRVSTLGTPAAEVFVTESSLVENGNGLSTLNAHASIYRSQLARNAGHGLYVLLQSSYSGKPAPSVVNSKIASNGSHGVNLMVETGVSGASFPYGHENNILDNNTTNPYNRPRQLYSFYGNRPDADWSNNYWGVPAEGPVKEAECPWVPAGKNPWHLSYGADPIVYGVRTPVPPGPINFSSHYRVSGNDVWWCGSDVVQGHPFSPVPFETPIFDFEPMTSAEERAAAIDHYRPFLYFDEAEHWQPVDVHQFLAEVDPDSVDPSDPSSGIPFHRACPDAGSANCYPIGTVGELVGADHIDVGDVGGGPPGGWPSPRTFPGGPCAGSIYLDCMGEPYSTMYYNRTVVDAADGGDGLRSYWDYWWYYRYNDYTPSPWWGDHEGDWEGMTVVTFAEQQEDPGPSGVLWVTYSEHGKSFRYTPAVLDWTGVHPHGFPSDGSHATYPYRCASGAGTCMQDANPVPEGDHGGELAWQQNYSCSFCVDAFPETTTDPTAWPVDARAGWNALDLRWGADGAAQTPGHQGRYERPWETEPGPGFDGDLAATEAGARTIDEADCSSWFGAGVVAVACDEAAMQGALDDGTFGRVQGSLTIQAAAAERVGTTTGLAQALGRRPLGDGEKVRLVGRVPDRADLRIRVATAPKETALARFSLAGVRQGTLTVRVERPAGRPDVQLILPDGRRRSPTDIEIVRRP